MKKYKNGMCLMKAWPFHLGHKHLVDTCISNCDNTYIFLCSRSFEIPNGESRYEAIKETYQNDLSVHIIHIADDSLPQEPSEHKDFWKIWYDVVYDNLPQNTKLDALFTSESYGVPYAEVLGCEHVLVDIDRKKFPVSGTAVRTDFYKNWNLLPKATQKRMVKKIAIIGPESVGKTMMIKKLSKYFSCVKQYEYGREYTDTCDMNNFSLSDIENIVSGHMLRYDKLVNAAETSLILFDTEVIETASWSFLYFQNIPESLNTMLKGYDKIDLFILLTPETKWVNDGTRVFSNKRDIHYKLIEDLVIESNIKYHIVGGKSYTKRFNKCIDIISKEYNIIL